MTRDYVMIRLVGDVEFLDDDGIVDHIFEENPMLDDLYPGEKRTITVAYRIFRGTGEIFDLSVLPIRRERFAFGGEVIHPAGYLITDRCIACGTCVDACPTAAISEGDISRIDPSLCLECGSCRDVCPSEAIEASCGLS
jgi:NAD-dependent dihydropyrimidine dehydrogenase PreA subunit